MEALWFFFFFFDVCIIQRVGNLSHWLNWIMWRCRRGPGPRPASLSFLFSPFSRIAASQHKGIYYSRRDGFSQEGKRHQAWRWSSQNCLRIPSSQSGTGEGCSHKCRKVCLRHLNCFNAFQTMTWSFVFFVFFCSLFPELIRPWTASNAKCSHRSSIWLLDRTTAYIRLDLDRLVTAHAS